MKRKVNNRDLVALTIHKIMSSCPSFETEKAFIEYLRKDAKRPKAERIAEGRKLMNEAKKELENAIYLY